MPELVRPPAVRMNARRIALVGTALWFVAFVVLLCFWGWLGEHDHRDWLWTSLAGWILGVLGTLLVSKHRHEGRTG